MGEKYKAPFWRNQLLIGTAHPAMMLVLGYYDAERERDRRKNMSQDELFSELMKEQGYVDPRV